jgi:endonuclease/exonuclease/phosphatase family metal-dependent hydrolase
MTEATAAPRPESTWRVMTWNIRGARQPNVREVAGVISEQEPDVAALQEVQRAQLRRLAKQLGWHYAWARKHYPYSPLLWWRAEGIGILSPWSVTAPLRTNISPGVSTWIYKHRVLLAATVRRRDGELRVFNTHLASHNADDRLAQAKRVADRLRADTTQCKVLSGDLNTTDDSEIEVLREFRAVGLTDAGGTVSNPAIAPYQRIDYVLLPDAATLISSHTPEGGELWAQLSDHLPVLVEFSSPATPNG